MSLRLVEALRAVVPVGQELELQRPVPQRVLHATQPRPTSP